MRLYNLIRLFTISGKSETVVEGKAKIFTDECLYAGFGDRGFPTATHLALNSLFRAIKKSLGLVTLVIFKRASNSFPFKNSHFVVSVASPNKLFFALHVVDCLID